MTMGAIALGTQDRNDRFPARGERVANWVEERLEPHSGVSVGELAFRIRADKRDVRRLLNERSCGSRLEDCLAAYYGWDFVESVMAPVVGADPLKAREKELAAAMAEVAAVEARLARARAVDTARRRVPRQGGLSLVGRNGAEALGGAPARVAPLRDGGVE